MRKARLYQTRALLWARKRTAIALFMEMRLGKSMVAIRWLKRLSPPESGRAVIVAPLSVVPNWVEELELEGFNGIPLLGPRPKKIAILEENPTGWFVTNYETFVSNPDLLLDFDWDAIILDESTRIKDPRSKTTKTFLAAAEDVPFKALLTGYPAPESYLDYFCQMKFLFGQFMGCSNYYQYRETFFLNAADGYDWVPKLKFRSKLADALKKRSFFLNRKKAGVGPIKVRERRLLDLGAKEQQAYKAIEKEFRFEDRTTKWSPVVYAWCCRYAGGFGAEGKLIHRRKYQELVNLLASELKGQQVVVWFRFNSELFGVAELLRESKYKVSTITGADKPQDRFKIAKAFNRGETQLCLVQLKCGKFGMDLSGADTAMYYSNPLALEERVQSEDRILKVDKKTPLLFIDLVVRDTVDEDISDALREKKINAAVLLNKLARRNGSSFRPGKRRDWSSFVRPPDEEAE